VQTVRVTELARQEPDAALFAISDEYKLFKETVQRLPAQGSGEPDGALGTNMGGTPGLLSAGIAQAGIDGVTAPVASTARNPLTAKKRARPRSMESLF